MDEQFIKYITLPTKELCNTPIEDVRRSIESTVNVFGFKPKEYVNEIKKSYDGMRNLILLVLHSAYYEAYEQTWVDGRNEFSNGRLKIICDTTAFRNCFDSYDAPCDNETVGFFTRLAKNIGQSLHRTNLQTFASLICYVLGTQIPIGELSDTVKMICGDDDDFYKMPMI